MITQYKNCREILTLSKAWEKDGRNLLPEDASILKNCDLIFNEREILYVGDEASILENLQVDEVIDGSEFCLTPEIVESHTHLVFGGDRSFEYTMRLNGATYEDIYMAGGGIRLTTDQTRQASDDELFELAVKRIEKIYSYGIGTIEIKSGYGLNYEHEKRCTLIMDRLKQHFSPRIQILNSYMAAHALSPEFSSTAEYMGQVVLPLMVELADKIDFVDIFHEKNYFNDQDVALLIQEATKLNLKLKIHADELNDNNGAKIALDHNFVSADHLLKINADNIRKFAQSKTTIPTLLPGTALFLGAQLPPAKTLLDAGAKVAIASDFNPGSCHYDNLLQLTAMTAKTMGFNFTQAWAAITMNAAAALNLKQGAIVKGLPARFSLFKTKSIDQIFYNWSTNFSCALK